MVQIKDAISQVPPVKVDDKSKIDSLLTDYAQPAAAPYGTPTPTLDAVPTPSPAAQVTPQAAPVSQGQVPGAPPVEYYRTGKKAGQPKPPRKVNVRYTPTVEMSQINSDLLSGALFLTLVDLMLPTLIVGINNKFSAVKVKVSELQMSEKQKRELAPIADKVMAQVNIQANPTFLLCASLLGIYGMNLAALQMTKATQSNEKNNQQTSQNNSRENYHFNPADYVQRSPGTSNQR